MTFDEALAIAEEKKSDIDSAREVEDAFIFVNNHKEMTIGGSGPIVILKNSGRAVNMAYYVSITQRSDESETHYKKGEDGKWQKTKVAGQE